MMSASTSPCCEYGAGFDGIGCVGDDCSPGTSLLSTGVSGIGQIGSPVSRSKVYTHPCFVVCAMALRRRPLTVMSMTLGDIGVS